MEEHFIKIEEIIALAETVEDLKLLKMEYVNQHRLVLAYFNTLQEEIETEMELPWEP